MKQILFKSLGLCALLCAVFSNSRAQNIYANREWVRETPETGNMFNHTASIVHNGNLIVTGSVINGSNGVDVFTIKYDGATGDTLWYVTESGSLSGGSDYGVDVVVSGSGDVIVTAAIQNSSTGYDYAVYRYTGSSGAQEWDYSWDGNSGIDIPAKILVRDNMNAIFVIGGSEQSSGGVSDFGVIRIDSSGSYVWQHFYDNGNNLHDAAVSGNTAIFNQYLLVVGASQQTSGDWFTVLDMVKTSDGTTYNSTTIDTTAITMTEARAMVIDDQNRIFVTGFSDDGGDKNIQSFALDSNLNLLWVANFSGDLEDIGEDIGVDANGNVYITGYTETSSGRYKAITIQYDAATGAELWNEQYGNVVSEDGMKGRKMAVTTSGEVFITGPVFDGGVQSFGFVKYDSDGRFRVARSFEADSLIDEAFAIAVEQQDIYITGFHQTTGGRSMNTIKYSLTEKDSSKVYNSTGKPVYAGRDLIVRVDTSLIKQNQINKLEIEYWTLSEIFDAGFVTDLERQLETPCGDEHCPIKVYRIFTDLRTTDTTTISRRGDVIKIPTFWATFVFELPDGVNVTDASDAISTLFPDIKYSTYNLIGELNSVPDDPEYTEGQICMHTDTLTPQWPDVHINIEPAWDLETGKRYIKTGVFDGPFEWYHEDFGGNDLTTTKMNGWSFEALNEGSIYSTTSAYWTWHGTASSGQIGAIRNNGLGIAGIAGGSYANSTSLDSSGTALYGLNVLSYNTDLIYMHHLSNAVVGTTIDSDTGDFTYGLHVTNHSYGISQAPNPSTGQPYANFLDTNITLLREAFHFSNRNQVVVVASRGNSGLMQDTGAVHDNYPGVLDDDWIICVGGLGTDGDYHDGDVGSAFEYGWKASRGAEIDVSSFSCGARNMTTIDSSNYAYYSGTSAAAPHVAGVAALMLSYLNHPTSHYANLAPEDVEYILQMTAQDRNVSTHPGYDTLTGYGIIDAGAALHQIRKDRYTVAHFGTDMFPHTTGHNLYSTGDTIILSERYENEAGTWFLPNIPYIVDAYKINTQSGHQIFTNEVVVAQWPRPSSSNVFALFDTVTNVLIPRERVSLDSIDNIWGYLHGFVYYVKDTLGNPLGWWPTDTSDLFDFDLTYTLLKYDTLYYLNNPETYELFSAKVYPNPTNSGQILVLDIDQPIDASVRLVDINGRLVKTVYNGHFEKGQVSFNIDLSELSPGMYLYAILPADGKPRYIKVMKQ